MGRVPKSQIDKVKELPKRQGFRRIKNVDWYSRKSKYHKVNGKFPYDNIRRLLKDSIGKNVDGVFRKYCKIVPKYQQDEFYDFLNRDMRYFKRFDSFYVDDEKLVQFSKITNAYKGPYRITSGDVKYESRHKVTGKKESEYSWADKKHNKNDYEMVLVQGWEKWFETKKDREYIRLKRERLKQRKRNGKLYRNRFTVSQEEVRRILREKELKDKLENLVKIESHGFNPKTSFRKEKLGVTEHK